MTFSFCVRIRKKLATSFLTHLCSLCQVFFCRFGMIEWSLKETNYAHDWFSNDRFHEKHKNKSMFISIKIITFPPFLNCKSNQEIQRKPPLFSQQELVVNFPSFTYTFHYFLSTPQIKARSSPTCLFLIVIFHFSLSISIFLFLSFSFCK